MLIHIQDDIVRLQHSGLLDRLLKDKTTKNNIMWATDAYAHYGREYERNEEIHPHLITGENVDIIKTRARKEFEQQNQRTRKRAEVFTPMWICRMMNDKLDEEWFGYPDVFFKADKPTEEVRFFEKKHTWQNYVDSRRLEITCGEAPYLMSRYDVATGEIVPIEKRCGIFDRKLRVVSENASTEEEWFKWAIRAVQATYGYEFQGDNVLIARINILCTFEDYLNARWDRKLTRQETEKIINIITWNIWQMDGLTYTIPFREAEPDFVQLSLFNDFEVDLTKAAQPLSRIYDWRADRSGTFEGIKKGENRMKFDFIIGNPPYQEEISEEKKNSSLAKQLFPSFIIESINSSNNGVVLITPARWFSGDAQDKSFRKLRQFFKENNHISSLTYFPFDKEVFNNVEIKGGVCYFCYNNNYTGNVEFSTIEHGKVTSISRPLFENGLDIVLTDPTKIQVLMKIKAVTDKYLTEITKGRNAFGIIGKEEVVNSVSSDTPFDGCCELRLKNDEIRYISKDLIKKNTDVFMSYKVFVSKSAGAPNKDLKVIGKPYLGKPTTACTDSLIPIGCFNNEFEAVSLQKYICTKFLRYMVSILKASQNVTQIVYGFVPLQDFTPNSDIDWSKAVAEIDRQLYAKYGLDETEIAFIESHVKEME